MSGFVLVDTIQHIRAPVWTYGIGLAASMAAIPLIAGAKGHRYVLSHSRLLLHPASGAVQGRIDDITATVRLQEELAKELERFLHKSTNLPFARVKRLLGRESYLDAQEALQLGLVDHVLEPSAEELERE